MGPRLGSADRADPDVLRTGRRCPPLPRRLPRLRAPLGLAEAFAFHERIGRDRVAARTTEQATALKQGLTEVDGITVVTPADPDLSAGIVCVDVRGMPPANAVMELRERGIVSSATPYRQSYLRLGPSIVTSPEDVDAAVAAVAELV